MHSDVTVIPVTDIGRRFVAQKILTLVIVLDEGDVDEQAAFGDDAAGTARFIADTTPLSDWDQVDADVSEVR